MSIVPFGPNVGSIPMDKFVELAHFRMAEPFQFEFYEDMAFSVLFVPLACGHLINLLDQRVASELRADATNGRQRALEGSSSQ